LGNSRRTLPVNDSFTQQQAKQSIKQQEERDKYDVNNIVYMVQVQLRLPEEDIELLDRWVKEGKYKSRSEALRAILTFYKEREKTMDFYRMLVARDRETLEDSSLLVPLDEVE
jgi:Arc/MetJ-type ribon-helix-helix transcriptional regulator